jgi:hypothetical protein
MQNLRIASIVIQSKSLSWGFKDKHCDNLEGIDIVELEPRKKMRTKRLSYGTPRNYSCYSVDELLTSFNWSLGQFSFANPDNKPPDQLIDDFSIDSMKQLSLLLDGKPEYTQLYSRIQLGLIEVTAGKQLLSKLKQTLGTMSAQDIIIIKRYLIWLFLFGMYNRYWKGPGHPWPKRFNYNEADTCKQETREEIVQKNSKFFFKTIEEADKHIINKTTKETLGTWLKLIPRVKYSWTSTSLNDGNIAKPINNDQEPIDKRLDLIYPVILLTSKGVYCQSDTSDIATQGGFFYYINLFNVNLEGFNHAINEYLGVKQDPLDPIDFSITGHVEAGTVGETFNYQ